MKYLPIFLLAGVCLYLGGQLLASYSVNADLGEKLAIAETRAALSEKLRREQALAHNLKFKELLDEEFDLAGQRLDDLDSDITGMPVPDILRQALRPDHSR